MGFSFDMQESFTYGCRYLDENKGIVTPNTSDSFIRAIRGGKGVISDRMSWDLGLTLVSLAHSNAPHRKLLAVMFFVPQVTGFCHVFYLCDGAVTVFFIAMNFPFFQV